MSNQHAIPWLRSEYFDGAAELLQHQLTAYTLNAYFPRRVHTGSKITFRQETIQAKGVKAVGFNEPTPLSEGNGFTEISVEPVQLRHAYAFDNEELSFFSSIDMLKQSMGEQAISARQGEIVTRATRLAMLPIMEQRHAMFAKALQGTITFQRSDGTTVSESLGLGTISATSAWGTASTDIPKQLWQAFDEFEDEAGVPCDTVFFNPKVFGTYLAQNTAWVSYIKSNEDLAAKFIGMNGSMMAPADMPRGPFRMFNRTWVPVGGKYIPTDTGTQTDRWPVATMTLAAINAGDGERTLEDTAVRDQYCPDGNLAFAVLRENDPVQVKVRAAMNTFPNVRVTDRVKVATLQA